MVAMAEPSRLTVGISGASGVIYGVRRLQALRKTPVESHLMMDPHGGSHDIDTGEVSHWTAGLQARIMIHERAWRPAVQ